jgi:GT2 family glycosyltransferase/glycosyltransferase involved in cell wall biosynthesis
LPERIKAVFASGTPALNRELIARMRDLFPELPLYIVSEFPPEQECARWIPYQVNRGFFENLSRIRFQFRGTELRLAGVMLVARGPYKAMRLVALALAPTAFLAFNENFGSFMLRPRSAGAILRHLFWRFKSFLRYQLRPGGDIYTFLWRVAHPQKARAVWLYRGARLRGAAGWLVRCLPPAAAPAMEAPALPSGISVVIPSRNGRALLGISLHLVLQERPSEVIVIDNGSEDGTASWLAAQHPEVAVEQTAAPLSFAEAVNRGLARARYSHVCLLNNDMLVEPGFFKALHAAFDAVPGLFCATAQIFFPPGMRREETGKAVLSVRDPLDFPVRCEEPVDGEDLSYVLYGSGGCSLYAASKLRALGGLGEHYRPAYVEDLDIGFRAWQRGWPSVLAANARVEHRHRSTTSRYYRPGQIEAMVETNYLRFIETAVESAPVFRRLWKHATFRLFLRSLKDEQPALEALAYAARATMQPPERPIGSIYSDEEILALGSGAVAVFPGTPRRGRPLILIATPYLPYPLSHGGAVRMLNLMRRAARDFDQVLVSFADALSQPPPELREIFQEIVLVRREGSHALPSSVRPEVVEEFDSPAFHAALRASATKWKPTVAQLEFTQMAQYARDCHPARTLLVEHDVTLDLYEQLVKETGDWEHRRQARLWRKFETDAWDHVDRIAVMSERDLKLAGGARATVLPNGVDTERFRPTAEVTAEPGRLLFIGSFAHLPNLMAVQFFLKEVWPLLTGLEVSLHLIAGAKHEFFLRHHGDRVKLDLPRTGVHVEGFVADVRPAYGRAQVVVAPLVASAGTNIKILEAMAMGKAIVTTPAGIHGLDLVPGKDLLVAETAREMADAIAGLLGSEARRVALGDHARATAERRYGWDRIALLQRRLYLELAGGAPESD